MTKELYWALWCFGLGLFIVFTVLMLSTPGRGALVETTVTMTQAPSPINLTATIKPGGN